MTQPISLIYDFTANPGQFETVNNVATNLVADVQQNDPGVINYQYCADPDTGRGCFSDTYATSEDLLAHMGREPVGSALGTIMENTTTNNFLVFGNPSPAAAEALAGVGATIIWQKAGFMRNPLQTTV